MKNNIFRKRVFLSVIGVLICAVGVAFCQIASFGVDPFQSFMCGVDSVSSISFGTLYVIVNSILLLFSLLFDRHYIGIATIVNLCLLGYVKDFSYQILTHFFDSPNLGLRILFIVIGILLISISCSLYITADLGVSTYDAIALILTNKWKLGHFRFIRIITDFTCVILGIALFLCGGGAIKDIPTISGIATIVIAFFMGPSIEFFSKHIAKPLLYGKQDENIENN